MLEIVRSGNGCEVSDWVGRDLTLSKTVLAAGASTRGHEHRHEETYAFVAGAGVLELDGTPREVSAGDALLIPGGVFHRVSTGTGIEFYCTFSGKRRG